jgi:hypothetical protein
MDELERTEPRCRGEGEMPPFGWLRQLRWGADRGDLCPGSWNSGTVRGNGSDLRCPTPSRRAVAKEKSQRFVDLKRGSGGICLQNLLVPLGPIEIDMT